MDCFAILAEAATRSSEAATDAQLIPLDYIWEQIITLSWLQAVIAVSFGVIYLLYGWRIFKALTVISFALLGLYAGMWAGEQFDKVLLGAVVGLITLAVLAVPLMRWAVSILGAVAGGILTGGVWYAFELPQQYIWAGAITGIIAGGMISFIIFKIAVMLFTSLGGGALIAAGMLSLLYQYENIQEPPTEQIKELFFNENWFIPVMLLIPTAIGILVQNKFVKGSRDWSV
jgi:hypothetical protein